MVSLLKKLPVELQIVAYGLKVMATDIPHGLWHTVRCEAVGRDWDWTTFTTEIAGEEFEFEHCSCCGYEQRVPIAYV